MQAIEVTQKNKLEIISDHKELTKNIAILQTERIGVNYNRVKRIYLFDNFKTAVACIYDLDSEKGICLTSINKEEKAEVERYFEVLKEQTR